MKLGGRALMSHKSGGIQTVSGSLRSSLDPSKRVIGNTNANRPPHSLAVSTQASLSGMHSRPFNVKASSKPANMSNSIAKKQQTNQNMGYKQDLTTRLA